MLTQSLPAGVTQANTYSRDGQPTGLEYDAIDSAGDTVPALAWTIASDVQGRTTQVDTNAGAGDNTVGRTLDYTYDDAGRLTDAVDGRGDFCQDRAYTFDADGNRTGQADTTTATDSCTDTPVATVTKAWSYDGADRVQKEAAVHSVVAGTDGDGNATTTTTDAFGAAGYTYDALGRVTTLPAGDAPANQLLESLGAAASGATAGDITLGYYDTDAARTVTQDGTTTTYALDAGGRRASSTVTAAGSGTVSTTRDYSDDGDDPSYATQTTGTATPVVSVYGSSIGGDLGFTVTGGAATLDLADPHGDTITTVAVPTDGSTAQLGAVECFDEYGNQAIDLATPDGDGDGDPTPGVSATAVATGALSYGYLGAKQRATDTTGLVLMGARLFNPGTGQFTSTDPVPGGNSTAYAYPQDPINSFDLNGQWGWHIHYRSVWHYTQRHWRGMAEVGLGAVALFGCTVCDLIGIGMSAYSAYNTSRDIYHHQYRAAAWDSLDMVGGAGGHAITRIANRGVRTANGLRRAGQMARAHRIESRVRATRRWGGAAKNAYDRASYSAGLIHRMWT
jgi:RHS repeat-associated protein